MSEQKPNKFYLTTPIYYVNARPHIGHAYTTIVADVLARRHRLLGDDTFFLTGTDEHGQKIERSAAAAGVPPQQFADQVSKSFEDLWKRMGITNDRYIRTTDPKHQRGAQKLFADLYAKGLIYLDSYTGQYSIGEEMFVEGPPGTIGPDGKPTETVTEENFFFRLSDYQLRLIDLIESNELAITPEASRNEVLKFLQGNVAAELERLARQDNDNPELRRTAKATLDHAINIGYLKCSTSGAHYLPGALRDLSVSRSSFTWGIPVPEPAASASAQKHVIYVWLDALTNYMTAIGYGSDDPKDQVEFEKYWPADIHLVGKEITRFHCVYWPAFLLAAGLPLPKAITAHGWLLFDNSKMSKSKGNIVRTETILDGFGDHVYGKQFPESTKAERDLFASDVLRYFLLREIPFGQDGSFSFDAMITRYNADLANGYGNLVSRTIALIHQNYGGVIPAEDIVGQEPDESWTEENRAVGKAVNSIADDMNPSFSGLQLAVEEAWKEFWFEDVLRLAAEEITRVDGMLAETKPWKLAKSSVSADARSLAASLYTAAESVRILTVLLYPILPAATAKVWLQLGLGDIEVAAANGELKTLQWGGLKPGTKLGPLAPIFPRADKGLTQIMIDMENPEAAQSSSNSELKTEQNTTDPAAPPRTSTFTDPASGTHVGGSAAITTEREATPSHTEASTSAAGPADASPQIAIDDFVKIELRVAEIKVAERIPKADKLLRLEVDLGYERRQILSGIAEWYTPEELIGRRIVVITNLAPRKMRGLESHGMLLAASNGENGKPVLATFGEDIALGSRLK